MDHYMSPFLCQFPAEMTGQCQIIEIRSQNPIGESIHAVDDPKTTLQPQRSALLQHGDAIVGRLQETPAET